MKKTLALALVAAMTISMASMTAFAKTTYNTQTNVKEPDELVATVTLTPKELAKMNYYQGVKFTVVDKTAVNAIPALGASYNAGDALAENDVKTHLGETLSGLIDSGAIKVEADDSSVTVKFGDLNIKSLTDTPTQVCYGWTDEGTDNQTDANKSKAQPYWGTDDTEPTHKDKVYGNSNEVTLKKDGDNYVGYFASVGKKLTTDDAIKEHVEEMEKNKKDAEKAADTAKKNKDKLQELDEKYGANIKDDNTNGYDEQSGKAIDITADKVTRKYFEGEGKTGMDDFFTHAAKIAGAPAGKDDDGKKTWVYDVTKTAGKLGEGNTVRVEFNLGLADDADLSKFTWKVYHIEGWCKATKVKNVEIVGNKLYAWVDSCSPFVVTRGDVNGASTGADASNPSTGDFSAVPVALLAAAALGATGFVAYKKRKAE